MKEKETLYARWLSQDITDEELEELKKSGALDDLKKIKTTTDQWKISKYDKEVGLKNFKEKYYKKETKVKRLNWVWMSGVAASLVLLFFVVRTISSPDQQVLLASNGTIEYLDLKEGTSIAVNDGSTVKYNEQEWDQERAIELIGEASFKVNRGKPFIVNTKNGTVKVLGTQFNVRARGDNLYVECYEGKVQVESTTQSTILTQGESVNVVSRMMNTNQVIQHTKPLWQSGTSRFYDEDVMSVLAELERQYDIKVQSPMLDDRFSGGFEHDNLENAVLNICKPLGLKYSIDQTNNIVLIEE